MGDELERADGKAFGRGGEQVTILEQTGSLMVDWDISNLVVW